MTWLWVFIGGGIGSLLRYGIGKISILKFGNFPLTTLVANVLASVCLGFFVWMNAKYGKHEWYWPFFAIGICGGFSTFSTFSMENVQLLQGGNYIYLLINVLASLVLTGFAFYLFAKLPQ